MPDKKLTKYDLKVQKRKEKERHDKAVAKYTKIGIGVCVAAAAIGIGTSVYHKYQLSHGDYILVNDQPVKKSEFDFYYYTSKNSFMQNYSSYLQYFGVDTSKDIDDQQYTDQMTWRDYFEQNAAQQIVYTYALLDEAEKNNFDYDAASDYDEFNSSLESYASENNMSLKEYVRQTYGSYVSMDTLKEDYMEYATSQAYYDHVSEETGIDPSDIQVAYDENKDQYDNVDYRVFKIAADIPEKTEDETLAETSESEAVDETSVAQESETEDPAVTEAMSIAKTKADEFLNAVTDESSFAQLCRDYCTEDEKETYADDQGSLITGGTTSSIQPPTVCSWLYEAGRQSGDKTVIEDTNEHVYYIVYFVSREKMADADTTIENTLRQQHMEQYLTELAQNYKVTDVRAGLKYLETKAESAAETAAATAAAADTESETESK